MTALIAVDPVLSVRLARDARELQAAQRLRYEIFVMSFRKPLQLPKNLPHAIPKQAFGPPIRPHAPWPAFWLQKCMQVLVRCAIIAR